MANEVTVKEQRQTLREYINSEVVQDQLSAALPKFMQLDRFIRVTYTAILENPDLLKCTKESIVGCMIKMAQLGLEPVLGKAWLIPYQNNQKPGRPYEAQFQVGWRGFVELAKRSGKVSKVTARTIFEGDIWDIVYGTEDKLVHKPNFKNEKPILYYAVFFYVNGAPSFMVMTPEEVDKIRKTSKAPNSPAWRDWFEQMAWKSAIKRLAKREDLSVELDEAVHIDDMAMIGAPQYGELPEIEGPSITTPGGLSESVSNFDQATTSGNAEASATTTDGSETDEKELERRALIKTFDAKVEATKIPKQFVNDYLFGSLENQSEIDNIEDLKIAVLENKAMDKFLEGLQQYADLQASRDLEAEEGASVKGDDTAAQTSQPHGETLSSANFDVNNLTPGDPDAREMDPEDAIKLFMNHRNPESFRDQIKAHPELVFCNEEVRAALHKKWNTKTKTGERFGGEFKTFYQFLYNKPENEPATEGRTKPEGLEAPVVRYCTQEQHKELDAMMVKKFGGWPRFMEWALATNRAVKVDVHGETLRRVTYGGAEEVLADPDKALKEMVTFHTGKYL